jgi:hypothetical protein
MTVGMKVVFVLFLCLAFFPFRVAVGNTLVNLSSDEKYATWKLCRKDQMDDLNVTAIDISMPEFTLTSVYSSVCFPAVVPGTALVSMLENNMFPGVTDPYYDEDLKKIPDIYDSGKALYTYYWHASLNISQFAKTTTPLLIFVRSLNYRANFFHGGKEVFPEQNHEEAAAGMFHRWSYPILRDNADDGMVSFAILVSPPDFVGKPNCGQGGDHEIAKNAAIMQYLAGWDWAQATPDRNTGLWDQVSLVLLDNDHATMDDVHVEILSNINASDDQSGRTVDVGVSATVRGLGQLHSQTLALRATVLETNESSRLKVFVLPPGSAGDETVSLSLEMISPKYWWPHTHGEPHLYHLRVQLFAVDSEETELTMDVIAFGVRSFTNYVDPTTKGRVFLCNGVKLFLQGGNWIGTDQLLRYSTSEDRYMKEVGLHKQMGLNLIRVWGGGIAERPEFYDACDRLGVMVYQEFWMTGDNNGRWAGNYSWPLDHHVYLSCVADVIKMLRNHASLLLWVGGNELFPEYQSPPPDIAEALPSLLSQLDPGRFFIPSSMSNYTNYDPEFALAPKDGPYGYLDPKRFDERNPGLKFWNGSSASGVILGFQPEIGSSATPVFKSVAKFIKNLTDFPSALSKRVPSAFTFHNYLSYNDDVGRDHVYTYGAPRNMSEYCLFAQMAQYCQVKGIFEGFQNHMFIYYTAMLFWKTQSPWPSFRGHMYDNYLETNGGFWGIEQATGGGTAPLHISLGNWTEDLQVVLVNRFNKGFAGSMFRASATWWHMNGTLVYQYVSDVNGSLLQAYAVYQVGLEDFRFPQVPKTPIPEVLYLRLELMETRLKEKITFNDYWLSDPVLPQNYSQLGLMRNSEYKLLKLCSSCTILATSVPNGHFASLSISNCDNNRIALAIRVRLSPRVSFRANEEIYTYSKQFFSLLPGESKVVLVDTVSSNNAETDSFQAEISGWNIANESIECHHA